MTEPQVTLHCTMGIKVAVSLPPAGSFAITLCFVFLE
jgi:hypothetical protein